MKAALSVGVSNAPSEPSPPGTVFLEVDMPVEVESTTKRVGEPLTRRELVVLAELDEHTTLEEIANRLFVTRNTVKSQVRSVYKKLGVSNRAEAVAQARALGLR